MTEKVMTSVYYLDFWAKIKLLYLIKYINETNFHFKIR